MSRPPAKFTQADIKRALAGSAAAGFVMAVEISVNGTIRLIPVEARPVPVAADMILQRVKGFK
jgi:hypothetical protein